MYCHVYVEFKSFRAHVENRNQHKIQILRTNRGGKFVSKDFLAFCEQEGIKRQLTALHTPYYNGVAGRMNWKIFVKTQKMAIAAHLLATFWPEAISTVIYLVNVTPTKPNNGTLLLQQYTGKTVNINHLKVFRCTAYAHI